MKTVEALVADDHTLFRKGLINLINTFDDMTVTAEAADGKEVLTLLEKGKKFDILILDLNMPIMSGLETVEKLYKRGFAVPILMVSMEENELRTIQLIRMGVKGYILKDAEPEELRRAIQIVAKADFFFNEVVSRGLVRNVEEPKLYPVDKIVHKLSAQEIEFLTLTTTDLTYKGIADTMGVSTKTIDGYRDELFGKLQIKTRVGLALFAVKQSLISLH
jgi:DNA-binding NarL/FixJ family response regulator